MRELARRLSSLTELERRGIRLSPEGEPSFGTGTHPKSGLVVNFASIAFTGVPVGRRVSKPTFIRALTDLEPVLVAEVSREVSARKEATGGKFDFEVARNEALDGQVSVMTTERKQYGPGRAGLVERFRQGNYPSTAGFLVKIWQLP